MYVECNLDLVTSNLVTNCDLVTVLFFKTFFSMYYIKSFDLVTSSNLVTVFAETKSVIKSRGIVYSALQEGDIFQFLVVSIS